MGLMNMFVELCSETLIYIIIAGVIVVLEAIDLFEKYFSKNSIVKQPKNPVKVNVILLCTHDIKFKYSIIYFT